MSYTFESALEVFESIRDDASALILPGLDLTPGKFINDITRLSLTMRMVAGFADKYTEYCKEAIAGGDSVVTVETVNDFMEELRGTISEAYEQCRYVPYEIRKKLSKMYSKYRNIQSALNPGV